MRAEWLRELFRIRYRLLLINALIVAVPILGIGFARFYEREMLRGLEEDMIHQAQLLRQALLDDAGGLRLSSRGPMLAAAARDTRTRIRLLDTTGAVVADSHAKGPPEGPEASPPSLLPRELPSRSGDPPVEIAVAERPEVRRALAGKYGAATRLWEKQEIVYLFSALPIEADGEILGVVYVTRSTIPVQFAMYRLRSTLFTILFVALGVTAVLTLFLAATISRPLSRLTRIAQRIARGDRSQSLALERRDEIGELARAFDQMARRLDERARYAKELAADISHEFKSPLTSMRGAAELLLEGAADDPAARERFLGNILEDARRLDRLVTRLLELSRFEADLAPAEVFDYEALAREAAGRSRPAKVAVRYAAKRTQLFGRRAHLASVLQNLLDNAQAHAAPGSEISLEVSELPGGRLRTRVHNFGPAISEANQQKIWGRFFTTRAQQGGTGLGLPIVAAVVSAHGGAVSVESSPEAGTSFYFELP